jgi:prepilin-type N-terminal cleavage/methylation domain-containing protein
MRRGFTLIEILISVTIFVVSATIMLGALFGATEVFRRGEASRQAGDEATAVLAALQEDLSRAVPVRLRDGKPAPEWGRIFAEAMPPTSNCLFSVVTENPDRSQVRWVDANGDGQNDTVVGIRQRVDWFVVAGADPSTDALIRKVWDLGDDGNVVDADSSTVDPDFATDGLMSPGQAYNPRSRDVVTRGCLHFGVWAEVAQAHRIVQAGANGPEFDWETPGTYAVLPFVTSSAGPALPLDTGQLTPAAYPPQFYPQPDALRISLVLTGGGRFATRGTLIQAIDDSQTTARVSGIKALPTIAGSLLRIGNEWVRYEDFRGGRLTIATDGRGALRSTATAHAARSETVLAGMPFSLVVALPR